MSYKLNSNISNDGLFAHIDIGNKRSYPGTGSTVYNIAKPLLYSTGLGNGTIVGAVQYDQEAGGSLFFNGTSGAPQWISFGPATNINPLQEFTFEIWAKSLGIGVNQSIAGLFTYTYALRLYFNGAGSILIGNYNKEASGSNSFGSSVNFGDNTWNHWAFSSAGRIYNLYRNGVLIFTTGSYLWIGSNWPTSNVGVAMDINNQNTYNFYGNVAIWRAYKRILSSEEIFQNFSAERGRFGV